MYKCGDDGKIHSTQSLIKYCECNQEQTACADSEEKCENGERKCDGQSVMVCKNNTWTEDRECTRNSYCNTEAGVICIPRFINQGVCDQSESVCNGQTLMKCENGLYKSVQPECGENQCVQSYCITSNLSEGSHAAQYEKTCRNTSYCIGTRKITCDINGGVSEDLCGGKSEVCILAESALDAAITATCAVPKCNEHIFYCDGDSLSYCFENNKIKLADCSQFGLVCKEGYGGGCVPGGNKI